MLTVFPIHILELITLALILLNIFSIYKQLSFEQSTTKPQLSIPDLNQDQRTLTPHHQEDVYNLTNEMSKPVQAITSPANLSENSHPEPAQAEIRETPHETKTQAHQIALKSYIGDFF